MKIPDDVPFEQAAFIEPVNTCYKAIRLLDLKADETVLVIGQGSIGVLLAALAQRTGATVLTSDLYPERHAIAAKFGLHHPLDARGDVVAAAKAATEGRGADVALVAVGGDALIKVAMDAVRPGGRVMLFASTQHGEAKFDPAAVCMDEKTLMGSYSASVAINDEVTKLVCDGYRERVRSDPAHLASVLAGGCGSGHRPGFASAGGFDEDCDSARQLVAAALLHFDVEALDLLVERGEGDAEVLGGLGLVPVAAFQAIGDDAPLDLLHQVEEGSVRLVFEQRRGVCAAGKLRRQQVRRDGARGGEHDAALHRILKLTDVARPLVVHQDTQRLGGERRGPRCRSPSA